MQFFVPYSRSKNERKNKIHREGEHDRRSLHRTHACVRPVRALVGRDPGTHIRGTLCAPDILNCRDPRACRRMPRIEPHLWRDRVRHHLRNTCNAYRRAPCVRDEEAAVPLTRTHNSLERGDNPVCAHPLRLWRMGDVPILRAHGRNRRGDLVRSARYRPRPLPRETPRSAQVLVILLTNFQKTYKNKSCSFSRKTEQLSIFYAKIKIRLKMRKTYCATAKSKL